MSLCRREPCLSDRGQFTKLAMMKGRDSDESTRNVIVAVGIGVALEAGASKGHHVDPAPLQAIGGGR